MPQCFATWLGVDPIINTSTSDLFQLTSKFCIGRLKHICSRLCSNFVSKIKGRFTYYPGFICYTCGSNITARTFNVKRATLFTQGAKRIFDAIIATFLRYTIHPL